MSNFLFGIEIFLYLKLYYLPLKSRDPDLALSYIVFRMAQSERGSGVKGKAIYNKNLSS